MDRNGSCRNPVVHQRDRAAPIRPSGPRYSRRISRSKYARIDASISTCRTASAQYSSNASRSAGHCSGRTCSPVPSTANSR